MFEKEEMQQEKDPGKPQMVNDTKTMMMVCNVCSFHVYLSNISSFLDSDLMLSATQLSSVQGH